MGLPALTLQLARRRELTDSCVAQETVHDTGD